MFKTFKDSLSEIEKLYDSKDYYSTILETAKLTEQAVNIFFNQFHTFLNSKDDWKKYLEFEQNAGDKFLSFLKRPTIGVAIGYYNSLVELFPNQIGISVEIKQHLNTINSIRNTHLHSNQKDATADEAGKILDALENILNKTNLLKISTTIVGVPIKYYLVFTSIKEKFESADSETDFQKIVDDSKKIIPPLLNILLNKVYHDLGTEKKFELVDLFVASVDKKSIGELQYYLNLCKVVGFEKIIANGASLKESLTIVEEAQNEPSRRQTRHFVNVLEIAIEFSSNVGTKHFLEFADAIKKRYLVKHKLTDNDRIILDEKAKDLKISKDLASRIEESVITTIEKELILFKTLTYDKVETETEKLDSIKKASGFKKRIALAGVAAVILIAIILWLTRTPNEFTDYERAYFEDRMEDAEKLSKRARSLDNVKSHYYFILSSYFNNTIFPESIKAEYRKLLNDNPTSKEAHFYLGMIYTYAATWREESDSAWTLMEYAKQNGLIGLESDLLELSRFQKLAHPNHVLQVSNKLLEYRNPRALSIASYTEVEIKYDTSNAINILKKAIEIYPRYVRGYVQLANIYIEKRQFSESRKILQEGNKINPRSLLVISRLAELSKQEGKFDEAKKYFKNALTSFGKDNKELYVGLLGILLQEDSITSGFSLVKRALDKYPKDISILWYDGQFKMRERWLKEEAAANSNENLLPWLTDYNKALEKSKKEQKPILIDFYTSWCYWCKVLDKKVYPDSTVQINLSKFILLKINAEKDPKLANQYEVSAYPTIIVVEEEKRKLFQLTKYVTPVELNSSLNKGFKIFEEYVEGKKVTKASYTQVTNLNDAKIISKSKGIPIMLLIGDKRSAWSEKLVNKTIEDPLFKKEFTQIIYLPVDKLEATLYLKTYNIKNFPTILFLDDTGTEYYRVAGYQPPKVLQKKVNQAKEAFKKEKIDNKLNWFYDLDETIALAMSAKKNIYVSAFNPNCDDCNWMEEETYSDKKVIDLLNEKFIPLHLEAKVDKETLSKLGIETFPAQFILNESGEELFRDFGYKSVDEFTSWLEIDEKIKLLSVLGAAKFKTFNQDFTIAKSLNQNQQYGSALLILNRYLDLLPDYYELHYQRAQSFTGLREWDEALASYSSAISKGTPITESLVENILSTFLSLNRIIETKEWLDSVIPIDKKDNKSNSLVFWVSSKAYQIAGNYDLAIEHAKKSIEYDPGFYAAQLQHGILLYEKGLFDSSVKYLKTAESLNTQNPVASFYLGLIAKKNSQTLVKKKYFSEANNRSSYAAHQVSSNWLLYKQNYQNYPEAIDMVLSGFENFLFLQQDDGFPYYVKSFHLLHFKRDYEGSLASINEAIEVNPEATAYKFIKAWVLRDLGRKDEYLKLTEQLYDSFSDDDFYPISDYVLGNYFLDKGDKKLASFHFKRASSGYRDFVPWFIPIQDLAVEKLKSL